MLHARPTARRGTATNWCDECGEPDPVVFRRLQYDVASLCQRCWNDEIKRQRLLHSARVRAAAIPEGAA